MTNNDLLRRLRYALNLNGETIAELCTLGGHDHTRVDAWWREHVAGSGERGGNF